MKKLLVICLSLLVGISAGAIVRPASLFNDGMVLQQQSNVRFCGRAKANTTVKVKGSWNNHTVSCKSDADGKWELLLPTPKASFKPYKVTLSDGDKLTINNVLIGEVWLGSGQSNMEMMVYGFINCPVENSARFISESYKYRDRIRLVKIPRFPLRQEAEYVEAKWQECTPEVVRTASAVGYFFATLISDKLNVPVGIINSSWGGTRVEGWTPKDLLEGYGEKLDVEVFKNRANSATPMVMYNGMLKPLAGYTLKGFLWYQGEANVWQANTYANHLSNMINRWRSDWKQGDLPFLFVEIAPYQYNTGNEQSAYLREAQCEVQHMVNNAYMVCTNDLVTPFERRQIHPMKKYEVAERLSLLALNKVYGMKGINSQSPEFQTMTVKDGKAILTFNNVDAGFNRFDDIEGFEICGADKKFVPATGVWLEGRRVVVTSNLVKEPVAVRYCFKDFQIGNLANGDNLPVIPFRTDK